MRNVLLIVALLFAGTVSAGKIQNDIQKKKADYYATEAVKYYKLDASKKQGIYEAKLALMEAQVEMARKKKNGELKSSEEDQYRKEVVYPYTKGVMDAIGVDWKKLKPFNEKVHPEMNKLKL
jgi:hypothetical protein